MTTRPDNTDCLWGLVDAMCNDNANQDQVAVLDSRLRDDPNACRFYTDYCQLHSALLLRAENRKSFHAFQVEFAAMGTAGPDATKSFSPDASSLSDDQFIPPIVSNVSLTFQPERPNLFVPYGWLHSYAAAMLIIAVALLGAWIWKVPNHYDNLATRNNSRIAQDYASNKHSPLVGRITGMKDCRWADPDTRPYAGSHVLLGRKFDLTSGLLEITYNSGAKVLLEGPCRYTVDSHEGGFLRVGKLVARVEKKVASGQWLVARKEGRGEREEGKDGMAALATSAKPQATNPQPPAPSPQLPLSTLHSPLFTIATPTAVVTDLGTEFGVEVNAGGNTTARVFRGLVELRAVGEQRQDKGRTIQLTAGELSRVIKGSKSEEPKIARLDASETPPDFVRRLTAPADTRAEDAYMRAVLADKPLGYWPLNEPAYSRRFLDHSGNGFHGAALGTVIAGQGGPLPGHSRSVELDGRGYIDIGRQDRFALANGFTVEAWAWIENDGADIQIGRIISAASCDSLHQHSGWGFGYIAKPDSPTALPQPFCHFTCYDVMSWTCAQTARAHWLHLAYTFDSDNKGSIYMNGELRAVYPAGRPAKTGATWVAIGWGANNNCEYWHGRLAHVAVYDSVLTQRRIQNHYRCSEGSPTDGTKRIRHGSPNLTPNGKEAQTARQ